MTLVMTLSNTQLRVLGCLIEKEATTPDQYPLSLNALTNACNQKSNREPILSLPESEVQSVVDELIKLHLVSSESGFGSRVAKYKHRFCNTEFGKLKLSPQELGVLCVMFLRGPQTPGELRTRTNRLCEFSDVSQVEVVLRELINSDDGPFVKQLPREPGKRESRYAHLFGEAVSGESMNSPSEFVSHSSSESNQNLSARNALETRVAKLEQELTEIKQKLADLLD